MESFKYGLTLSPSSRTSAEWAYASALLSTDSLYVYYDKSSGFNVFYISFMPYNSANIF